MTATSADGCCTKGWVVAVDRLGGWLGSIAECVAEQVDGVVLEAESDVGVHRGGHADVGVAQQFLDHDEFDALLKEKGRRRVPQIMEADAAEGGSAEQGVEVPGEVAPSIGLPSGRVKT